MVFIRLVFRIIELNYNRGISDDIEGVQPAWPTAKVPLWLANGQWSRVWTESLATPGALNRPGYSEGSFV